MEEKKDSESDFPKMPNFKKAFDGFVTEDLKKDFNEIKKDATRGFYRSFAALAAVAFGWIVFITLHCFLWSTGFTFYHNLVITFDSIVIAVLFAVGLVYQVSGLRKVYKKARGLISRLTEKMKSHS